MSTRQDCRVGYAGADPLDIAEGVAVNRAIVRRLHGSESGTLFFQADPDVANRLDTFVN